MIKFGMDREGERGGVSRPAEDSAMNIADAKGVFKKLPEADQKMLAMAGQGYTNKEIAERFGVSQSTVSNLRRSVGRWSRK